MTLARRSLVYCTFDGVANIYHGIGTQTRYLLSCLADHAQTIRQCTGTFDVHILVPDASYSRPGYAVDEEILRSSHQRIRAAGAKLWELKHDDSKLFHIDKWHQLSAEAAKVIQLLARQCDKVLVVGIDAVFCMLADHLDRELGPELWERTQLVYALHSSSRIPGTKVAIGREEAEISCVARANTDPRVFLADIGSYFSRHLIEEFGLNPNRLRPFTQSLALDDPELQPKSRPRALQELSTWAIPTDRPIILSMGRADPIKGFDRAICALTPLRARIHFVLIAVPYNPDDAEVRRYQALLAESGLRYTLVSEFSRSLPRSLCSLDETAAVLATSVGEPSGQVPQEVALWARAGGPVAIVADEGGLADQICDGINGFKFSQSNVEDITLQVVKAVEMNDHQRRTMRGEALAKVKHERDFTRSLVEFLKSVWVE